MRVNTERFKAPEIIFALDRGRKEIENSRAATSIPDNQGKPVVKIP
jgi:hypothetical protein